MSGAFGINSSLDYCEFEFDSADNHNAFTREYNKLDWPLFLFNQPLTNLAAIKILECQIPFSYYVFGTAGDPSTGVADVPYYLNFLELDNGVGTPNKIAVPLLGTYTASSLTSVISTQLNDETSGGVWTVTYDSVLYQLNYVWTPTTPGASFNVYGLGAQDPDKQEGPYVWLGMTNWALGTELGENPDTTYYQISSTLFPAVGPSQQVYTGAAQITGPNYVYINSDSLGGITNVVLPQGSGALPTGGKGPQLAKIPVNCGPGGVIFWQDPDPQKWFDLKDLTHLTQTDFYVTLGNSRAHIPLQFNGQSFSIKLGVLVNTQEKTDNLSSTLQQGRVAKRMRPA